MDLRAERVTLNKLFGTIGEQFQVPPFQRPYAWEAEQVDDLWDDLISTLEDGHFLGTVVLSETDDASTQIIDGQQRLTTLLILLGLIRDEYDRLGSNYSGRIQQLMLADSYAHGDDTFRLRVSEANWRPFRDLVLRSADDPERLTEAKMVSLPKDMRARNTSLVDNRNRLDGRLKDWLAQHEGPERVRRLERLEKSIVGKIQMVAIRVGSVTDAFLLFETLNDRGLQLSAADLLKNHLLAQVAARTQSEGNVREAAAEWDRLLDDLGPSVDVTRFLRHYLLISQPKVRKDDVFDRFKDGVAKNGPYRLLGDLRVFAKLYGDFEDPNRVEERDVAEVLEDLKILRAVSCYSALMPARRFLSSADFVAFARLAEVLTYRYSTIASLDSKELERVYHRAAKLLAESEGAELEAARSELIRVIPDSETFKNAFMHQRMGKQYLVRYTLGRIEEAISQEREKQLRPNAKVHIEHIMPQTPSEHWQGVLQERMEEYPDFVNRWGNLTLLYYRANTSISNGPFSTKRLEYERSEVTLTRRLAQSESWDLDSILDRQAWLAAEADRIWSIEVLDRTLPEREAIVTESHPSSFLGADEAAEFESYVTETSAEEALGLRTRVDGHLRAVREHVEAGGAGNLGLAEGIAAALSRLIDGSGTLDARGRSWLRGAVEYFVAIEDSQPDLASESGLDDDAGVVNAVMRALGDEDGFVEISSPSA